MANQKICSNPNYTGKAVKVAYHFGCFDKMPVLKEFKIFPSLLTKGVESEWETVDSTTPDTKGFYTTNLATTLSFNISGDGICLKEGKAAENFLELSKFHYNPISQNTDQPALWFIFVYPDITFIGYMNLTSLSRNSVGLNEMQTFDFSANLASSPIGLRIADTKKIIDLLPDDLLKAENDNIDITEELLSEQKNKDK